MAEKKKYDSDIVGWFTRGGKRIPIRVKDKEKQMAKMWDYANVQRSIKTLKSDAYDDGTYNAKSLKPVEYPDGYQVTFCQIGDKYSNEEYNGLIQLFLEASADKIVWLGKFEGEPEISFYVKDKSYARRLAKMFNQKAIWDWKECKDIFTGGTGVNKKRRRSW